MTLSKFEGELPRHPQCCGNKPKHLGQTFIFVILLFTSRPPNADCEEIFLSPQQNHPNLHPPTLVFHFLMKPGHSYLLCFGFISGWDQKTKKVKRELVQTSENLKTLCKNPWQYTQVACLILQIFGIALAHQSLTFPFSGYECVVCVNAYRFQGNDCWGIFFFGQELLHQMRLFW